MANEIAKQTGRPIDMLKSVINAPSVQEQFKNALGNHKDAFVASLIDLVAGDKALQTCKPAAVVAEALRAATMNLPINKALGFSYVVVFNNNVKNPDGTWTKTPTPTFIPGYKGYIQLAMRTGQYKTINADIVYEGEISNVDKLSGTIHFDGKKTSDKIIGYFAYFELVNGFTKTLYMSLEDMADYALRYSPSFKGRNKPTKESLMKSAQDNQPSNNVGWAGNFNDMAIKTVLRRLISKYGYLSVEMQNAVIADNTSDMAQANRNDAIMEEANAEVIDTEDVEVVDTETGEVTEPKAEAEEEEPNY